MILVFNVNFKFSISINLHNGRSLRFRLMATVCQYALFIYLIQIVANREFSVYRLKELTSILFAENN